MDAILQKMLHTWAEGGWVMIALAGVALITYATAVHLLVYLRQPGVKKVTDAQIRRWVEKPSEAPRHFQQVILYSQEDVRSLDEMEGRFREVEAARIPEADRRLAFLNIIVVSAPLFGLLGTVLGMLLTFKAIGIGGSSTSEIIAKGISEALVATQTGMTVAIPGLILAYVAKRWRNENAAFLARLESISLRHFRSRFKNAAAPSNPVLA